MLEVQDYQCPYCGEDVEAVLDLSAGDQRYIEDCPVCCRPSFFPCRPMEKTGGWMCAGRMINAAYL